uniref:Uncharacterized protein n=1 Tax=Cucumis melo TaxID=3656 RepID=A0A9I9CVB9_CUCME
MKNMLVLNFIEIKRPEFGAPRGVEKKTSDSLPPTFPLAIQRRRKRKARMLEVKA